MWTDEDTRTWLQLLAPDREERIWIIRQLLLHANEDRMSAEDRTICRKALEGLLAERPAHYRCH